MSAVLAPPFFFSSRRRHTRFDCDWSSDVCSSDLAVSGGDATGRIDLRKDAELLGAARTLRKPFAPAELDRKSTRLNSSHSQISYAVFCLKKKKKKGQIRAQLNSYGRASSSSIV